MCQKSKIISRVKKGELSFCNCCKKYSLIFNNISFQLDKSQLIEFKEYISKIDVAYWLEYYSSSPQKRKIPVPTFHQSLLLFFDVYEIEELKSLLGLKGSHKGTILSPKNIDYNLVFN